jgi:hypothetical protein
LNYLYRAVDKHGKTVDFLLRPDRSVAAAQAFFRKALSTCLPRWPRKITFDGLNPWKTRPRAENPRVGGQLFNSLPATEPVTAEPYWPRCDTKLGQQVSNFVTLSYVDLSSDAQLIKVTRVHEGPVALLACRLGEHTQVLQEVNRLAGGWLRRLE